jgi:hypothetical protein
MSEDTGRGAATNGYPERRDSDIKNPAPPPPPSPEETGRMTERIVATDDMLQPLEELIQQASDPDATRAAILSRCNVNDLHDLTEMQVEWQIQNLKRKLKERGQKR